MVEVLVEGVKVEAGVVVVVGGVGGDCIGGDEGYDGGGGRGGSGLSCGGLV